MNSLKLLDSHAILAYLSGEPGGEKVKAAMEAARDEGRPLLLCEINAGEVYYILSRRRGKEKADYFMESIVPSLPVRLWPVDFSLVMDAARLKAVHALSYADCFAVAVAVRTDALILTGDPEFKAVEGFGIVDNLQ